MFNQSRRQFIKGAAYSSALAMSGLSSLALATDGTVGIAQVNDIEVLTLINQTASNVTFNGFSCAGSTDIYQYLSKVNKFDKHSNQDDVNIAPGEQLSFVVPAISSIESVKANNKNIFITDVLEGHLAIKSDHPKYNGIVPITVFETT